MWERQQQVDLVLRMFGCGIDKTVFDAHFNALEQKEQERIIRVAWRVRLTLKMRYELLFRKNPYDEPYYFILFGRDLPSLEIYLLFTCLDTLAGPAQYIEFPIWLKKQLGSEHLSLSCGDVAEYHDQYKIEHGIGRNLRDLFNNLPPSVKGWLSSNVRIGYTQNNEEVICWKEKDQLPRYLCDYFYNVRRNLFTHSSVALPTEIAHNINPPSENNEAGETAWYTPWSGYGYSPDSSRPNEVWICQYKQGIDEAHILRMIIWGAIINRLKIAVSMESVEAQVANHSRLSGLYELLGEIHSNSDYLVAWANDENLFKTNLGTWMFQGSIPTLHGTRSAPIIGRLRSEEKGIAERVTEYRESVNRLNQRIEAFNNANPRQEGENSQDRIKAIRTFLQEQVKSDDYKFIVDLPRQTWVRDALWRIIRDPCYMA